MEVDAERESTGSSTPPLLNKSSDSSEDDFDLPAYVYTTKCKELDTTPPMSNDDPSTSNLSVPSSSPFVISPLKLPPTIIVNDEKENRANIKLLSKTVNCVKKTRERKTREDRIDQIERSGGVLAMSMKADATIKQVNKDIDSPGMDPKSFMQGFNNVVDLPHIPGIPFFIAPPNFHQGFSGLSSTTGNPLIDRITGEHADVSGINQLVLALNGKECPCAVLLWLIENACLSHDIVVRTTSLFALSQVAPICSSLSSPIQLEDFHAILSKLGVTFTESHSLQCTQAPAGTDVNQDLLRSSVSNFTKSVLLVLEYFKLDHCDPSLMKGLSIILLRMSLDPLICSNFVSDQVSVCLQTVIANADDQTWKAMESEIMSFCCAAVSNHYNQYCVITLLSSSYPRVSMLQFNLIRLFLTTLCHRDMMQVDQSESQNGHLHDMILARNVIQYFTNNSNIAFDELHSAMKMLAILLKSPKMQWGVVQNFKKKDLVRMLSKLSGGIKDNMPGVVIERGPVKDFIISLKLELQSSRYGEKVQMSVFDYTIEEDDN